MFRPRSILLQYVPKVQSTKYVEYRAVSGVFQNIDPPLPLHTSECVQSNPRTKGWGTHSPGGEGVGGQYFGRRHTLDWSLTA
jgi:hypothetical protein